MRITIRMNATEDSVEIDGETYDRSTMNRRERRTFNQMVRETWTKVNKS